MLKISVIIPVYNAERTIAETIDSVLKQTFINLELIIINDGSTDATLEILQKYTDPRLKVFSYPNAGLAASRNRGIKHASGEYISFIDADDLWTSDKLEAQFNALQGYPEAGVAYSWTDYIDESSKWLYPGTHITVNGDAYAHLLLNNFLENGSNPLIRRQALIETGGYDETLPASQDRNMYLRLAARYPFAAVPSPQILYRVSSDSMSTNVWRLEKASLQVIEQGFNEAPDSLQRLKPVSLANLYKFLINKCFDGIPENKRGFAVLKFLYNVVENDPKMLRSRVIWKVLFKGIIMSIFPTKTTQFLFKKLIKITSNSDLTTYLQLNPDEI